MCSNLPGGNRLRHRRIADAQLGALGTPPEQKHGDRADHRSRQDASKSASTTCPAPHRCGRSARWPSPAPERTPLPFESGRQEPARELSQGPGESPSGIGSASARWALGVAPVKVADSAQAEHIAPLVGRVPGKAFGGGVRCALTGSSEWLGPELHQPKANELHQRTVVRHARDEDTIRRQVSVDEAHLMGCLQAGGRLQD